MAILESSAAQQKVRNWQQAGKTVVFTNGCFDLLHAGHIDLFNQARALGDFLIIGLNSDHSIRRLKGINRPVQPEEDRAYILDALEVIDLVVIFNEDTPARLIKILSPDVLVKGSDYRDSEIIGADYVRKQGGRVARIALKPGCSTSLLIERIRRIQTGEKS